MGLTEQLISVAQTYACATGLALSTVSRMAARSGNLFGRLTSSATLTVRRYEEVMRWFSAHWPPDTAWPDGVERPVAIREAAE